MAGSYSGNGSPVAPTRKTWGSLRVKAFVFTMIGIALLTVMFYFVDFERLLFWFGRIRFEWLLIFLGFYWVALLFNGFRWRVILSERLSILSLTFISAVGYWVNLFLPLRFGDISRFIMLKSSQKVPLSKGFVSVGIEKFLDLGTLGMLAFLLILFSPKAASNSLFMLIVEFASVAGCLGLFGVFFLSKYSSAFLLRLFERRLLRPFRRFVVSLNEGFRAYDGRSVYLIVLLLLSFFTHAVRFLPFYAIFLAFGGFEGSLITLFLAHILFTLISGLMIIPAEVGTFELYWTTVFVGLGLMDFNFLLSTAIIAHSCTLIASTLYAAISSAWLRTSFKEAFSLAYQHTSGTLSL